MKKVLALSLLTALTFQACSSGTQTPITLEQNVPAEQNTIVSSSAASRANHSPMFADKLKMGKNYKVLASMKKYARNSMCGKDDKQEVNSYDGTLGQTTGFVKAHQGAVAAIEDKSTDSSSKFCSGTMISEDLFLTASHCIESGDATKNYLAFNYEKSKGASTLLKQEHFKVLEVVEEGGSSETDYSILRIEGKPGAKFGFSKVNTNATKEGDLFTIIQHPSGKPKQVEVGHRGKATSGVYMGYGDLDTEPGSSGSGVLNEAGEVVGVHTNGGCGPTSGENKAVMLTEIAKVSKTVQTLVQTQVGKSGKAKK